MFKQLFFLALFAFLINLAWEVSHSLLYKTTTKMSVKEYVPRILRASGGDIIIIFIIFFALSIINQSFNWNILATQNLILSILFGLILSITIELLALSVQRWEYLPSMPLIPFINVGITPVLQMIITQIITFFLTEHFI